MSNLIGQILVFFLAIGIWNGIVQAQVKAEECLSDYLLKYDDFYQEFALAYRCETFSLRKSEQAEKERLRFLEGVVVESASRGILYAGSKSSEPIGSETPSTMEELTIGGKLFTKQYGTIGNTSQIEATAWGGPSDANPVPKIIPCIQPHGLALLRDQEMLGRRSEIRSCVSTFLQHKKFVDESDLEKGGVRGIWETQNKALRCTIDFSPDEHPLPVKVVWEYVGNPKLGKSKSTTITKWKTVGDKDVPEKIDISSQVGEGTTEVRLEFVFLKKERFEKEIKEIKPDFVDAKGPWIDRFTGWFEN
jgi:hypothetical protein